MCNVPTWTARSPEKLPPLPDHTGGAMLRNHTQVAEEYHVLREKHEGLSRCVEENSNAP